YVLRRPIVRIEGDENKQTVPQIFDDRYTEEDLIIEFEDSNSISNSDIDSWDASAILDDDDDAWLSEL
ncbi:hypothetical protein ACQUWZ_27320, partial [Ralstonia pseudosolanacearum]|uniref:hypothetical protein n=1 Tax=Ralstonia pseudosolanacearum TaxID=1310165 RepID=UPI003D1870AA